MTFISLSILSISFNPDFVLEEIDPEISQRDRNASDLIIFGSILEAFQIKILFNIPTNSSIKNIK